MEVTEFARISGRQEYSESRGESINLLLSNHKDSQLLFKTESRGFDKEELVERTTATCTVLKRSSELAIDAFDFKTNRDILLSGIGLYTGRDGADYEVDVEILQSTKSLFKRKLTVPSTGNAKPFEVLVNEPIFIRVGVDYSVSALSRGYIDHYGRVSALVCTEGNVTFTFSHNLQSRYTVPIYGQIATLYFRY